MEEKKLSLKKGENGLYGCVDPDGKWVYEPQFKNAFTWGDFIIVSKEEEGDEVWGWMDNKGEWMEEPYYGIIEDNGKPYLEAWYDGDGCRIYPDGSVLTEDEWEEEEEDWDEDEE